MKHILDINMTEKKDQIFLLEILVQNSKIDKFCLSDNINVYLEVRFGDLPCFTIHPETFKKNVDEAEETTTHQAIQFNCGKSCLFHMSPTALVDMIKECPVVLGVIKVKDVAVEPEIIAQAEINLSQEILNMVLEAQDEGNLFEPINEVMQDNFELLDINQDNVGEVGAFVRLTCLGCSVLTQVKVSADQKFQFGKEQKLLDSACKGCEKGRPGPDINCLHANVDVCESLSSKEGSMKKLMQKKESQIFSDTNSAASLKKNSESCCSAAATKVTNSKVHNKAAVKKTQQIITTAENPKKKRTKGKFAPGIPNVSYPGVRVGHMICHNKHHPIPAKQGWAWKTTLPEGLKKSDRKGWRPGFFSKCYLRSLKNQPNILMIRQNKKEQAAGKTKAICKKPTLHILRKKGVCHLSMDIGQKGPQQYEYLADSSDSDLELNLNFPETIPLPPPKVKHQAQQFCEEDFIEKKTEETPPPKKQTQKKKQQKKKKQKELKKRKLGKAKKGEDLSNIEKLVKPWDNWVLQLKCTNEKGKKTPKEGKIKKKA